MSIELYLAFVVATALLIAIPGPNIALIVANSLTYGTRYGLLTVAGTSATQAVQLALVVFGFAAMMAALGAAFDWIRWIGVAYLIYLGVKSLRSSNNSLDKPPAEQKSPRLIFGEAVLVSATNPKVLLFYGAFFPQFLDESRPLFPQLMLLAITFWVIAVVLDSVWAIGASRLRPVLVSAGRWHQRVTGGVLLTAAAALAAARRSS